MDRKVAIKVKLLSSDMDLSIGPLPPAQCSLTVRLVVQGNSTGSSRGGLRLCSNSSLCGNELEKSLGVSRLGLSLWQVMFLLNSEIREM